VTYWALFINILDYWIIIGMLPKTLNHNMYVERDHIKCALKMYWFKSPCLIKTGIWPSLLPLKKQHTKEKSVSNNIFLKAVVPNFLCLKYHFQVYPCPLYSSKRQIVHGKHKNLTVHSLYKIVTSAKIMQNSFPCASLFYTTFTKVTHICMSKT
jgi:hypothetical protein